MYEQYFGLNKKPFSALAEGPDVFVGPQTAKTMAALKKALEVSDAVATVTGPVGVGKTTLVKRALQAIGLNRIIISVGRIQLHHDEVLELLLDQLGIKQLPASTVQRFSRFRRLLKGLSDQNIRVFVVVEDAARIGCDTLSELEALTASDAGVSDGANIILMGGSDVEELLKAPQLARMKQRIRLRESIAPLGSNEMGAYLKHSFRQAGGDFNSIFDASTADLLHRHSEGIPRVVNNMIETTLGFATDRKVSRVTSTFVISILTDECGFAAQPQSQSSTQNDQADPAIQQEPTPASLPTTLIEETYSAAELDAVMEPGVPVPEIEAAENAPVEVLVSDSQLTADIATSEPDDEQDENPLPELIQDTFPSLTILKPDYTATELAGDYDAALAAVSGDTPSPDSEPGSSDDSDITPVIVNSELPDLNVDGKAAVLSQLSNEDDGIPTLSSSMRLERPIFDTPLEDTPVETVMTNSPPDEDLLASTTAKGIEDPQCDFEPALAELQPDLEALERAMAYTQRIDSDLNSDLHSNPEASAHLEAASPFAEITLDQAIQDKIAEATKLLEQTTLDLAEVAAEDARIAADAAALASAQTPNEGSKADANLDELAANMAKFKTLEEVDEKSGETLFGEEFSSMAAQIAAHIAANPLPEKSANDDLMPAPRSAELIEARSPAVVAESVILESDLPEITLGTNTADNRNSSARRFVTVTALDVNSGVVPENALPQNMESVVPSDAPGFQDVTMTMKARIEGQGPNPIEDQIGISLTQTLKALNVAAPTISDDDDFGEVAKGGFFSRFRRS